MQTIKTNILLGCLEREVLRYLKDPIQTIFNSVFSNFLFLTALFFLQPNEIGILIPGILIFTSFNVVSSNVRMTLFVGRMDHTIYYQLAAPISRISLYMVYLVSTFFRSILVNITLLLLSYLFFYDKPIFSVGGFIMAFIVANITFINIGILLALYYKNWNSFGVMENYFVTPLLFLSGAFFSLENIRANFHILFHINPFFHLTNFMKYTFEGRSESTIQTAILLSIIFMVVTTGYCLYLFHTGRRLLK